MKALEFDTIVATLRHNSNNAADQLAVAIVAEDSTLLTEQLTYRHLDEQSRQVAAMLLRHLEPGMRVLLLVPQGAGFVVGFLGTLYAGMTAVPINPPTHKRHLSRLEAILRDSDPQLILTLQSYEELAQAALQQTGVNVPMLTLEHCLQHEPDASILPHPSPDAVAFLQYTSGTTGIPRGVVITHANLMANQRMIHDASQTPWGLQLASWLPLFHDMGLIGSFLHTLCMGGTLYLMSPLSFLKQPRHWLQLVTERRCQGIVAPSFAYDLCVRRISPARRRGLDLSTLQLAFCGAEPINPQTLHRFCEAFGAYGFKPDAFFPCYGLAEATLMASAVQTFPRPVTLEVDAQALSRGQVQHVAGTEATRTLASSGQPTAGTQLYIVHPETRQTLGARQVGEIWLRSAAVSPGYWRRPELNAESFDARRQEAPDEPCLRTGDLGFLHDGQLYVTGRIKDLIIVRGRNHYPQDLERTAAASSDLIQPLACAAFALDQDHEALIGVVCEVLVEGTSSNLDLQAAEALARSIREAIAEEHALTVGRIAFIAPRTMPITSSGKVQRRQCRELLMQGRLNLLYHWERPAETVQDEPSAGETPPSAPPHAVASAAVAPSLTHPADHTGSHQRAEQVIQWLRAYAPRRISSRLMDERRSIAPHIVLDFGNQGLLGLAAPLELGGLELCHRDRLRVLRQLTAIDATLGTFVGAHNDLGLGPLLRHAAPQQRIRYLAPVVQGRMLASFAFTEVGAGSNPLAMEAYAAPVGPGQWKLYGTKRWIGTAAWASLFILGVQLLDEQGQSRGITLFIVPEGRAGLTVGPEELTMGMRGMTQNIVRLEGVLVSSEDLLGEPGQGLGIAHQAFNMGRLSTATGSLGVMKRSLQLMGRYAQRRSINTGNLLDNAFTRLRLSQLRLRVSALEALLNVVAITLDAQRTVPEEIFALLKIAGPESAWITVDACMQLLGGRGYIETNLVPQLMRDVRLLRIVEGPTETLQAFLGTRLLLQPQAVLSFLREQLQNEKGAQRLEQVLTRMSSLRTGALTGGKHTSNLGLLPYALAEVGAWALWLAIAERDPQSSTEPDLSAACRWLAEELEASLQRALVPMDEEKLCSASELERLIRGYEADIGDVQQLREVEVQRLDPILMREPSVPEEIRLSPRPVAGLILPPTPAPTEQDMLPSSALDGLKVEDVQSFILDWLAHRLQLTPEQLDPQQRFASLGMDSLAAVELMGALQDHFRVEVPATASWSYPTVALLSRQVVQLSQRGAERVASSERAVTAVSPSNGSTSLALEDAAPLESLGEASAPVEPSLADVQSAELADAETLALAQALMEELATL